MQTYSTILNEKNLCNSTTIKNKNTLYMSMYTILRHRHIPGKTTNRNISHYVFLCIGIMGNFSFPCSSVFSKDHSMN